MKRKKAVHTTYAPLLCWDIFMEGYHRRIELADDLKKMQKISMDNSWSPPNIAFDNALIWNNKIIIITDPVLTIIHATENIFAMNGYQPGEVIGHSPKMFQGEATTHAERRIIRTAVDAQKPFDTVITNYKKDGTLYKCHIEGYPIFNRQGTLVNFMALEKTA